MSRQTTEWDLSKVPRKLMDSESTKLVIDCDWSSSLRSYWTDEQRIKAEEVALAHDTTFKRSYARR